MAFPLRLPAPVGDRDVPKAYGVAVEIVAALAGIGAIAALSTNTFALIIVGAALVVVAGFALVFSRPAIVVEISIITMWFDSVGVGPLRTGRLVAGLTVVVLAARIMSSPWRPPMLAPRAWAWPAAFFIWAFASGFWAAETGTWLVGISELTLGFIYAIILLAFVEDEAHFARSMKAWVWSGVPIAIISYFFYNKVEEVQEEYGLENRIVGFSGNANHYARLLILAVAVAFLFSRRAQSRRARLGYLVAAFLFSVALVTTGSRAGMVAMVAMMLYLALTLPGLPKRQRVRSMFGGGALVIVGWLLAAWWNPDRYSIGGFLGDAGAGRIDLWNAAIHSIQQRPINGHSISAFRTRMLDMLLTAPGGSLDVTNQLRNRQAGGLEAHNTYLTIILDLGFIGLALYLGVIASVVRNLWDMRKTQWADWAWILIGAQVVLSLTAAFGSTYNVKFQWMVVGVAGAVYVRARSTDRVDRVRSHSGLGSLRNLVSPRHSGIERPYAGERAFAAPMDLRLRYPLRWVMVGAVVAGAVLAGGITAMFGSPTYSSRARVIVADFANAQPGEPLTASNDGIQFVLNLTRSSVYYAEVLRQSGVDLTVDEIAQAVVPTRPNFGANVAITATTKDEQTTRRIGSVLVSSLDAVVEAARSGSVVITDVWTLRLSRDLPADYDGPLYLVPYRTPVETVTTPRVVTHALTGAALAALLVFVWALAAHSRQRVRSDEDLERQLGLTMVAAVPRPLLARERHIEEHYRTAADLIDSACPVDPRIVGFASTGIDGLRSRVALWCALGLSNLSSRPIVIVDLDATSANLSRQLGARRAQGIVDVARGGVDLASVTRPIARRMLTRSFARLVASAAAPVSLVPVGGRGVSSDEVSMLSTTIAELVDQLAEDALVIVSLPSVPGPVTVEPTLVHCDAVLMTVLDGWTPIDDTILTIDSLVAAADDRVGLLLVDQ